jgi:hypothetical protein
MPSEAELLAPLARSEAELAAGQIVSGDEVLANWTRALPAWRRSVRAGRFAGPLLVVDRADAGGQAARPGAVCVLRGTRSAGGDACPTERAQCRVGENHHFAGGWPARATALKAACRAGPDMAQVRALLDWLPDLTHNRHRRRLFRDGEYPRPRVAWLDRPMSWPGSRSRRSRARLWSRRMRDKRCLMVVVEIEHGANRIRRDPAVVLNQPFDPLLPVRKKILWAEPRPLDDGLAAPLSGHRLDQRAFCPVDVLHGPDIAPQKPDVPARAETPRNQVFNRLSQGSSCNSSAR